MKTCKECKEKTWYVYGHWLPNESLPFYIGVGTKKRAWTSDSRNKYWNNIVKKYGKFEVFIILDNFKNRDNAVIEEIRLQLLNKPKACIQYGDRNNCIVSEETRRKMSKSNIGKKKSSETKEKLRIINTGKKHTDESKALISKNKKGKKLSKEHSINIGKGHSKRVINCRGEIYNSTEEAASTYNIGRTSIKNNINNHSKTSGKYADGTKIEWKFYYGESNAST